MKSKDVKRKLKINFKDAGYNDGDVISILCYQDGTPKDLYWRRRVKDAKRNNCVEFVDGLKFKERPKKPAKSKSTEKED